MKKFLSPFVALFCIAIVSCSNDNDTAPQTTGYNSTLKADDTAFVPVTAEDAKTSWAYGYPDVHERVFNLTDPATSATIQVYIIAHNTNASGTYSASASYTENALMGQYKLGNQSYTFGTNSKVVVKDNGNNHYKLTFTNVTATGMVNDAPVTKNITGSFEGTFTDDPWLP
ncbi:hypothetical protein ACLI1A_13035 [Flavobacterium sp. RHBU_3]|uniref:hypothetical protein n=1 Tax=Flavobacterium sp. RHBU_3 TaxID=3391184 RepID=UPI003984DC44